ncbi:hypothetical protein acdb102_27140 [Acidothermaceae bacterium B102]|nr:hypothetical protein acdb102_27140 [Acidothermaceae bacterium B102]
MLTPKASVVVMTQFTTDSRWHSWLTMLSTAKMDIHQMAHNRAIWLSVVDMLQRNQSVTHNQVMNAWLSGHYTTTQAVAIRRQCDVGTNDRPKSMGRLLTEMVAHPSVFTRDRYLGATDGRLRRDREAAWQRVCDPDTDLFDVGIVDADLTVLRATSAKVRKYVDKSIAHSLNSRPNAKAPITFRDINESVTLLGAMSLRYVGYLEGSWFPELGFDPAIEWLAPFQKAWMPDGYRLMSAAELGLMPGTPPADI